MILFTLKLYLCFLDKSKGSGRDNKKAWTCHFVYAYRGIAKHHCSHIRVKAHAAWHEHQLLLLTAYLKIWRISISKNKANASLSDVLCLWGVT